MANKRKKKIIHADLGPVERLQHNEYVEVNTNSGVKGLKNITHDPLEMYKNRKTITQRQFEAGDIFAKQYRKALLVTAYSQVRYNNLPGGELTIAAAEAIQMAKQNIRDALKHVGHPLDSIIIHVVGDGQLAGTWSGVYQSKRSGQDGVAALRLALDGLCSFYNL